MTSSTPVPLFILEIANNHMGDVQHAIEMVRTFSKICKDFPFHFAFKLQYRDLDTYIHPNYKGRDDIKYVKRFSETKLTKSEFDLIVSEIKSQGFIAMATPFDEASVNLIEDQKLGIIKIASCSFTDWPLLERISKSSLPVVASTAGSTIEEIDRVVSFFIHRSRELSILHCIGEYPTPDENSELSQIDFLRDRYPDLKIGYSTHENPNNTDNIKIAIAKGAQIFERHIALPTDKYSINEYSSTPQQILDWLKAAQRAYILCGNNNDRHILNKKEAATLMGLRRGVFSNKKITKGQSIKSEDIYFAFPAGAEQFTANDWSKYSEFTALTDLNPNEAVDKKNSSLRDIRSKVWEIAQNVKILLKKSNVILPGRMVMEISHHYGLDEFDNTGITILTVINRGYCKKLIVVLPNQKHPEQYHLKKDETFQLVYGEIELTIDGVKSILKTGDIVSIEPGQKHSFLSQQGAVIEELSTTHFRDDSYYTDERINQNKQRKTLLSYWMD